MTNLLSNKKNIVLVAIDVAKARNDILVELPNGNRKKLKVANMEKDYQVFIEYLRSLNYPCEIGLEATANYHRNIAYHLQMAGFKVHLISALLLQERVRLYIILGIKMIQKMLKLSYTY